MEDRQPGRGARSDAQALALVVMFWASTAIAVLASALPGVMDVRGGLLPAAAVTFVVAGASVLRARGLTARSAHVLLVVAVLGGNALVVCVEDPVLRSVAAGWNLLIVVLFSASLPRRTLVAGLVACAALAGALVGLVPGDPLLVVLRAVTVAGLVAVPLAYLVGLRGELDAALDLARDQARRDSLTGLLNRRALQERFPAVVSAARRSGSVLAVTSLDLDHFKRVNDTWGHAVGDEVLVAASRALLAGTRGTDLVVRLGGEELVVVQVVADVDTAVALTERLRGDVATACDRWSLTTSAGVATWDVRSGTSDPVLADLLETADQRLYRAKTAGRDRAVTAG